MKRKVTLFTHFYGDAIHLANTLYRQPAISASLTRCDEEEWLYNDGEIRVEINDCIYRIYKK